MRILDWLAGHPAPAERAWRSAGERAERLGFRYDEAVVRLEAATRAGVAPAAARARTDLLALGVDPDGLFSTSGGR